MKKIVVLTYGDANKPSTWSNVPYLLVNALKKDKNHVIKSYNIETKQNLLTYFYSFICLLINRKSRYYFVRSKINYNIVMKKIKKIVDKEDNDTDLYLLISYDYDIKKYTNKKVMLLSDWNVDYDIENWLKRKPFKSELKHLERTKTAIRNADYVVSLVESFKNYATDKYHRPVYYFGMPINAFYDSNDFNNFYTRKNITFIGKKSYIESAREVLKAFENMNLNGFELHFIGLTKKDFIKTNNSNVYFHGYLNKGKENELKDYYDIIKNSLVVINTSEKWSGLSSISEVLYYYRPIIIAKNSETLKKFGNNSSFVFYSKNNAKEIEKNIRKIMKLQIKDYRKICVDAHDFVKENTYDKFVTRLLDITK